MPATGVLAFVAGTFGVPIGESPLLQAARTNRRRSSLDVSLSFLIVLLAGGTAWLAYGIALGNIALIAGNSVGVVTSTAAIAVSMRWRALCRARKGRCPVTLVTGKRPARTVGSPC